MIAVSLAHVSHDRLIAEHRALAQRGAELVELRLDYLADPPDLDRLLGDRPTPVIVTCRREQDGGRWQGGESRRVAVLREAVDSGAEYVDVETDVAGQIPRAGTARRIVSHHDFDGTPHDLDRIHAQIERQDPDVVKLVTMARVPSDVVRVLRLADEADVPTVAFCMGELGLPSRVLCARYGAPFTFAAPTTQQAVAPGQMSLDELRTVYRYDQIDRHTQVFGVLGDPIAHSMSPLIHNTAFQHTGLNAVYLPLRVPADAFSETLDAFQWLDFRGYSVTIPHKQAAMAKADDCDQAVRDIGAANTLYRDAAGRWQATNTDYQAALDSLEIGLVQLFGDRSLQGRRVLMLGAGGVARAVGMAVRRAGASLTIANRTHERAVALAEQLDCGLVRWRERGDAPAEVLVNCTAVGMHPDVDRTPYPAERLGPGMLVFDTIYNPERTLLLEQAEQQGCQTVGGMEMFVRQAARQFELFTGRPAPIDRMRQTVRQRIPPAAAS